MGSGLRRERRKKPGRSTRGPGRVFPQSYGLDRVAHSRSVTGKRCSASRPEYDRTLVLFLLPQEKYPKEWA